MFGLLEFIRKMKALQRSARTVLKGGLYLNSKSIISDQTAMAQEQKYLQ